jgi:dipeptidyl aminopeptidase/acylaminoacyl peptidase
MLPAESSWNQPPEVIRRLLNAPPPPSVSVSPDRSAMLLFERNSYPDLEELAAPCIRMGGFRLNPRTRGPQLRPSIYAIEYRRPVTAPGSAVQLPPGSRVGIVGWSPDSRWFAFTLTQPDGIELWLLAAATGLASRLGSVTLSAVFTSPAQWMPDSSKLLILLPAAHTSSAPAEPLVPPGPVVEECHGKAGPLRTLQDLLRGPHDEALFEYYGLSRPALISAATGRLEICGPPGLYADLDPAPDGLHLLATTLHRPWSGTLPWNRFPRSTGILDRSGMQLREVFRRGLEENIPIEGVPVGPRAVGWMPSEPTRMVWLEALDGGDPRNKVEHRDRLLVQDAPFTAEPRELLRSAHRCSGVHWGADPTLALYREYDRDRRWTRTWQFNPLTPQVTPRLLHDRSIHDRYNDPGSPITRRLPNGRRVLLQHNDCIFLEGPGATPSGDRPFLRKLSLLTGSQETLFLSSESEHESVLLLMEDDAASFLTIHETPISPPNLRLRSLAGDYSPLTNISDPVPDIRNIHREIISVTRPDGVPLSFTLYLPPGVRPGTPLPTLLWAYPREFSDPETAGQITGSINRFTTFAGSSPLHLLLAGYAVLDHTVLPVVGDPETANNTFIEQIVAGATAITQRVIDMGVADPDRLAVGGHSYGALLAVTLLAHSGIFRAGIARSGAYNRTLTPFGFQNERRTFWEAPDIYMRLSPFAFANRIHAPLLLIHGEADNNPGTYPMQSERLYQAIRGNGGTARCVLLPHESHSYAARQSVEHVIWEMLNWLERHLTPAANTPLPAKPLSTPSAP